MTHSPSRRVLLLAAASTPFIAACSSWATDMSKASSPEAKLAALEASSGGRLGVAALNTANGAQLAHRADERFALCSTCKVMIVSAILARSAKEPGFLQQRVRYTKADLVAYSPITETHVDEGMTIAELCAAGIDYSDNTSANLLMRIVGGPSAVTAFARSTGDDTFRLDRWETELNTAIPGDPRDTTTPAAMLQSVQRLALGDLLGAPQRDQLQVWMRANTTGGARIRAGVPAGWDVIDKTGTGDYGTTNDVAVLWPPAKPPIVLVTYFTQNDKDAKSRSDVLADAARIVVAAFA
ncbi:class A beta-lactamase [Paraburkholderia sp. GAS42]|jgi:beta-lactamase class A|uniref:class A beta-lactamase n=1 Tax=Paraburkholderia sp. GAS42 TaxID=3035135 RepID=UPI003D1FD88C